MRRTSNRTKNNSRSSRSRMRTLGKPDIKGASLINKS
jgi:hypothetical protein